MNTIHINKSKTVAYTGHRYINTDAIAPLKEKLTQTIREQYHIGVFEEQPREQATTQITSDKLQFEIVDYSEKAIALFGDTKPIKDLLLAMGGKFNPRLTHNEEKQAGWIFSKTKRAELETIINLNN